MAREYDQGIKTPCSCGKRGHERTVKCEDCFQYPVKCVDCFLADHLAHNPFHWAMVWDSRGQYFRKHDISQLQDGAHGNAAIHLGHNGARCTCPYGNTPWKITIAHTNGIHGTQVRFCYCTPAVEIDMVGQLMRAGLFPATTAKPKTAFSFTLLREYRIHLSVSKKPAYDYHGALQRLTDNTFTFQVMVSRLSQIILGCSACSHSDRMRLIIICLMSHGLIAIWLCVADLDRNMGSIDSSQTGQRIISFWAVRHVQKLA